MVTDQPDDLTEEELRDQRFWDINDSLFDAVEAIDEVKVGDLNPHEIEDLMGHREKLESIRSDIRVWGKLE